jgi:hypothetical protein
LDVPVRARGGGDGDLDQPRGLQRPPRVRERDGQRAAAELDVGDAPDPAHAGPDRGYLAVQGAADDGQAVERLRERPVLLHVADGGLERRVREGHDVRVLRTACVEPSRQVRVEDVEPAGPELQLARLHVHEHLVAELHRPRQPRVRDRRMAVDLEADETVVLVRDPRDRAAAQAQH